MNDTGYAPRWRRLLDGGRSWGALEVSPTRYGVTRYRLVVFPPGISADDRMLLRAWRSWPVWGLATWLAMEIVLTSTVGPGPALAISTAAFVGTGALVMAMSGANRADVRTMTVIRMAGPHDPVAAARFADIRAMVEDLVAADDGLAAGGLSAVEHEARVWRVYDRMASHAHLAG